MKNQVVFIIVFLFLVLSNCLKAKRSPFDVSKPSPGLIGVLAAITGLTNANNASTNNLSVTSTSPADSATGVTSNSPITITFNQTMDKSTITTNSNDTTCSGSVQISFDNFATCVKMRSSITTTDNKTFTLSANPTMGTFATHKIKITTTAASETKLKLATDFSHTTGFTTSTPCTVYDANTCPIPFSTAATLTFSLTAGGLVIPIESGAAKGKLLVTEGGSSGAFTTNLFNPDTGIFSTGPNLTALHGGSSNQTFYFNIPSGIHSGKILINHGDPSGVPTNTTSIYDPVANTMIVGPTFTTTMNPFPMAFSISSGVNAGKIMVLLGGTNTNLYDPSANSFSVGPNLSSSVSNNAHLISLSSGANSGKTLIIHSGGSPNVSIYDPTSGVFTTGPNLTPSPNYGAHSFLIPSGSQSGNILTIVGNTAGTNSILINSINLTASIGPSLPNSISPTSSVSTHSILINQGVNSGKLWLIHGSNSTLIPSDSSFYDSTSNTFSAGPTMITQATSSSKTVFFESGIYANKYMTFYGGKKFTSLYDPIKNAIDPSSILPSAAGNGVNKVLLTIGSNSGKMLIINGGNNTSSLFDFASGTFSAGPNLTGVMGRSPGIFTISGGSQDGKIFVVHGGGLTTTSLYDPSANTFSAGPALSAAANNITSECIFKVPSGTQSGKYLIIHGNISQTTSLYDPSTNTISSGPSTGANMGVNGVTCFPITSGSNAGKFIATQGLIGATATRMYDPGTNTFGAGPTLSSSITAGAFAMPITNGANAGKSLIIIGSGTTTNLYDPTTHTFSLGPNLSASATGGAYLPLTVGANKDKYLIMHGTTTSIYDPNTNGIIAGPSAPPDGSILGFNATSGLFNQGVLLIVGGSGNLTSVIYP